MGSSAPRVLRRAAVGAALGAAVALAAVTAPALAQRARPVTLRIQPHVGDTLYTRFEQEVEITGTTRVGEADTTMRMTNSMLLLARVLVDGSDDGGTTVTTITDSVTFTGGGISAGGAPDLVRQAVQGKKVQLHIAPDGSATVLEAPREVASDVQAVVSGVPSTLPGRAIQVGGTWEKVMSIPVAGRESTFRPATLRARYRLDSLSADGTIAFISMRGTITREASSELPRGMRIASTGTIVGSMQVDRKRGWWCDSRSTIALTSEVTRPGEDRPPMHVVTRISQRMRAGAHP